MATVGVKGLLWRFWSVEISLHFNLAFSQGVLCKVKFQVTSHVNRIEHYRLLCTTAVGLFRTKNIY